MCSALICILSIHCLVDGGLMQLSVVRSGADGCDELLMLGDEVLVVEVKG